MIYMEVRGDRGRGHPCQGERVWTRPRESQRHRRVPSLGRQWIVDLRRELIDQDLPITWQLPSATRAAVFGAEWALQ